MAVIFPYLLTNLVLDMGKLCTVVHVSSMYGVVAPTPALYGGSLATSPIQYGVAKAAQIHLAKEQSVRLAPFGVRVNAVSFGGITGRESKEFSLRYNTLAPLGRMLDLSDVVGAVDFLVSDASKGMTGHNLIVDGGWTTW